MKRTRRLHTNLAILGLRLWVGLHLTFAHGLPALKDTDTFLSNEVLERFALPELSGWAGMLSALVGGLLLSFGLLTRTAAVFLLITLIGTAWIALDGSASIERELALTYAACLVVVLVHGPGALSVDEMLERKRRSRSPW